MKPGLPSEVRAYKPPRQQPQAGLHTAFGTSSRVTGNSQYCCCSSVCTGPGLPKAPVCSDPSKQLVWQAARQKPSQLTGSTCLSGRPPREPSFPVVRYLTHIQVALVFCHLKRNSGRNADCWEFSKPGDTHKGVCAQTAEPAESLVWQVSQWQRGRCSELTLIFVLNN